MNDFKTIQIKAGNKKQIKQIALDTGLKIYEVIEMLLNIYNKRGIK
jgi:hypothetical protein